MKKIYLDEIDNKQKEMVTLVEKEMKEKINELKNLTNNLVWQGPAYTSYIKGYNTKIDKLEEYNNGFIKLANFLTLTKDNYQDANNKINTAYEEILAEFMKTEE